MGVFNINDNVLQMTGQHAISTDMGQLRLGFPCMSAGHILIHIYTWHVCSYLLLRTYSNCESPLYSFIVTETVNSTCPAHTSKK